MPANKKISELSDLITPDGNDFVLVLQQSNDGTSEYRTYKTEISNFLASETLQDAIVNAVADNLGSVNDVLGRLVYDSSTQQIKISNSSIGFELSKDPSTPLEAATKQYVDARETAIRAYVDTQDAVFDDMFDSKLDLAGGTMTGEIILDSDFPANPRAAVNANYVQEELNAINVDGKLDLAGGTMTGALILSGAPTLDLQAATKSYVDTTVALGAPDIDTNDIPEGTTNLYFTSARARAAISVTGSLSYNTTTGEISYTTPANVSEFTNNAGYINKDVDNLTYYTSTADLESDYPDRTELKTVAFTGSYTDLTNKPTDFEFPSSDDVPEGNTNRYFTQARFDANFTAKSTQIQNLARSAISAGPGIVYNSTTGVISSVDEAARAALSGGTGIAYNATTGVFSVDTAVIATQAYVTSQIATKDNSDEITEGTANLYFTNTRARSAISAVKDTGYGNLAYNSATGVLTYSGVLNTNIRSAVSASGNLAYDADSGVFSYTLPTASTTTLGGVKVDGTTITISGTGVISAVGGGGGVGLDPTFTSVTATTVNTQNLNFSGTGPVTFTSNNDLNLVATGTVKANNEKILTLTQLKSVVAASADFADFKIRVQGLS